MTETAEPTIEDLNKRIQSLSLHNRRLGMMVKEVETQRGEALTQLVEHRVGSGLHIEALTNSLKAAHDQLKELANENARLKAAALAPPIPVNDDNVTLTNGHEAAAPA